MLLQYLLLPSRLPSYFVWDSHLANPKPTSCSRLLEFLYAIALVLPACVVYTCSIAFMQIFVEFVDVALQETSTWPLAPADTFDQHLHVHALDMNAARARTDLNGNLARDGDSEREEKLYLREHIVARVALIGSLADATTWLLYHVLNMNAVKRTLVLELGARPTCMAGVLLVACGYLVCNQNVQFDSTNAFLYWYGGYSVLVAAGNAIILSATNMACQSAPRGNTNEDGDGYVVDHASTLLCAVGICALPSAVHAVATTFGVRHLLRLLTALYLLSLITILFWVEPAQSIQRTRVLNPILTRVSGAEIGTLRNARPQCALNGMLQGTRAILCWMSLYP